MHILFKGGNRDVTVNAAASGIGCSENKDARLKECVAGRGSILNFADVSSLVSKNVMYICLHACYSMTPFNLGGR